MTLTEKHVLTQLNDIKPVAEKVLSLAEANGALSEEKRFEIELVVNELLVNCFKHASPSGDRPVVLAADVYSGMLRLSVTDSGEGFEFDKPGITSPLCERGRGLALVRAMCREMKYNIKGNSVEVMVAL